MKNKLNIFLIVIFVLILISIFHGWFFRGEIIGGDWPYIFKESLSDYYFLVPSWNTWQGNGLGGTNPIYFLQSFEYLTVFLAKALHIPWQIIYKIFWFGSFVGLSMLSSIYLLKTIFSSAKLWQVGIAALIFTTNTYILMVVGGGQMGIALAYSVAPLVLATFIKLINFLNSSKLNFKFQISNFKLPVLAGLVLSLQVLFDPRIAYITMIAVAIYVIFNIKKNILNTFSPLEALAKWGYLILYTFIIPGLVTVLLHIFWILPLVVFSQNLCERFCEAYANVGIVKFLSFSTFSQSFSLLHSNWPENIFGKVGFMKPEFLAIPVIAYASLFFIKNPKSEIRNPKQIQNSKIIFFVFLGLLGSFLAKGANPPFGEVYLWFFNNVPGFVLFRDPTKFYLLTALSYSVLIPFSIWKIYELLRAKSKFLIFNFQNLFLLTSVLYLLFLVSPAIFGQLGGTFENHEVPKEYIELKDFLYKQSGFFRTLWVPRQERFAFLSSIHPSVEAGALFDATTSAKAIKDIKEKGSQYFSELSVKYVIVPYDSLGEIFQKDRKYDQEQYINTVKGLESIPWLRKINGFGKIQVFEISTVKDHFWLVNDGNISYKMVSPTHYFLNISSSSSQELIFSEKYNPSWIAKIKDKTIRSQRTSNNLNSFTLKKGDYDLEIVFLQDKVYGYARVISLATFLGVLFFIFKYRRFNVLSN